MPVKVRVDRIRHLFPEAVTLSGVFASIERMGVADFLLWRHPTKVARFICLTELLREQSLEDVVELRAWLQTPNSRAKLMGIKGVGPKTADYLCGLVGLDYIAVDRHIRTFASDAGVAVADYDSLQVIVSYAADLLGVSRRDFDASIWKYVSERKARSNHYQLI
jgi:thermostable 8-oxoguanine DNA glycosylase